MRVGYVNIFKSNLYVFLGNVELAQLIHCLSAVAVGARVLGENVTARPTLGALDSDFGRFVFGDIEH